MRASSIIFSKSIIILSVQAGFYRQISSGFSLCGFVAESRTLACQDLQKTSASALFHHKAVTMRDLAQLFACSAKANRKSVKNDASTRPTLQKHRRL
jgi:hypothetical protein